MKMRYLILLPIILAASQSNERILPEKCDCLDWFGSCRGLGESWTDDGVWKYECTEGNHEAVFRGCVPLDDSEINSGGNEIIAVGRNESVDGFWHSCEANDQRIRYERESRCSVNGKTYHLGEEFREGTFHWLCLETGRWVKGCYFTNETGQDVLIGIGEQALNGLVKHVCDRYTDYPGRVQYYTQVRDDVHVKHPGNKGDNNNFPVAGDFRIHGKVERWLHENAESFIANVDEATRVRVRYLPASRRDWQ